jgi:hypothetical protein
MTVKVMAKQASVPPFGLFRFAGLYRRLLRRRGLSAETTLPCSAPKFEASAGLVMVSSANKLFW